jgi:transposase
MARHASFTVVTGVPTYFCLAARRGQHPRQHHAGPAAGDQPRRARRRWAARTAAAAPRQAARRQGYDYPRCRRYLHQRGIKVRIARRGIEDKTRLGRVRWVVERTMAWLLDFRRLALRYDRTETTVSALLSLACSLICRRLR